MLRRYLRQEAPSVSTDQGWLSMTSRLRARRIMRIARWPLFLVVLAGVFVWIAILSSGGCARSVPGFGRGPASEPRSQSAPANAQDHDRSWSTGRSGQTVAAYQQLRPWGEEQGTGLPGPGATSAVERRPLRLGWPIRRMIQKCWCGSTRVGSSGLRFM